MQTPAGYEVIDGRFFPKDWMEIIFNPSFPYRLAHTVTGFYVTTGFVVIGVAAWLLRKGRAADEARTMLSTTLWVLLALVPLQILLGDMHGLNTLEYQPTKLAAIEAHWNREARAPLALFAIPDEKHETNHFSVDVPVLGSLILTHDPNGVVPGLKEVPPDQRPPVAIPFFAFRIMVGIGLIMLAVVIVGNLLRRGGRLYRSTVFLRACEWAAPLGFIAVLAGWTTTEVGRQPWTVYGLLRTADSVSPSLTGLDVALSFGGYIVSLSHHVPGGRAVDGKDRAPRCGGDHNRGAGRRRPSRFAGDRIAGRTRRGRAVMMPFTLDLVPIWTFILGVGVFLYVLLDGFDLGVGILFGFAPDTRSRNLIMNSIAPIWDGNETWLILGSVGLMAAFPLAFAIIIPAVYFPIAIMLLALVFRGVAFEFRYRDVEHKSFWDHGFSWGSVIATFAQGIVLGAFIQGFKVDGRHFVGSSFDCFTPFSLLTGLALVLGYALLGAGWLVLKTDGDIQLRARRHGRIALVGVLIAVAAVSISFLAPAAAHAAWPCRTRRCGVKIPRQSRGP